jgi:hypothetical protein
MALQRTINFRLGWVGARLQNGMTALINKIRALEDVSRWGGGGYGVGTDGSVSFHSYENSHDIDVEAPLAGGIRFDDIRQQSHPLTYIRRQNIDSDDAELITRVSSIGRELQKHLSTIHELDHLGQLGQAAG